MGILTPDVFRSQGPTNACIAFAAANTYQLARRTLGLSELQPSVLFVGNTCHYKSLDSAFRGLKSDGVCREALMPWTPNYMGLQPSAEAIADAAAHKVTKGQKTLNSVNDAKQWIAQGYAVGCTFGGHEATIIGYDDATGCFSVLDSTEFSASQPYPGVWTDVEYSRPDLPGYVITGIAA